MLTAPLVASGTLISRAGLYPQTNDCAGAENFVLHQGEITLTGGPGDQTHRFSVADDPRIGGLAEGIRGDAGR